MARMHRTQIYLDEDLSAGLDRLARQRGTSKAQLIRTAARRFLLEEEGEDPILGLIGLGHGGHGRVSEDHDRVLNELALDTHS